ncbi:MAG: DsbA family protein [Anaerolineales bacterium]
MSRKARQITRQKAQRRQALYIYGGLGGVILLIGSIIAFTILDTPPEVSEDRLAQEATLGSPGAQVQIVEYGAYGCSTCRALHESQTIEQLVDLYGDQVSFTFRNWPNIIPSIDPLAAQAAQCALDQGNDAFWTMHDALFTVPLSEYRRMDGHDQYARLAQDHGLDGDALQNCLAEDTHARTVTHWEDAGDELSIRGTPTIYVNGQLTSANNLRNVVERELGG